MKALSATALAGGVALAAQDAQAACSDAAAVIIGSSAALSSNIPLVGNVASTGLNLFSLLACGGSAQEPLNVESVVELIRTELDQTQLEAAERGVFNAAKDLRLLGTQLNTDFDGTDFSELTTDEANTIVDTHIIPLINDFEKTEDQFFAALTTPNNNRESYDLSAAIVLANYKLFLSSLAIAAAQDAVSEELAFNTAERISLDVIDYQTEAARQRDVELEIRHQSFGSSPGRDEYTPILKRQGTVFFVGTTFSCVVNPISGCPAITAAKAAGRKKVTNLHAALDRQDLQLALLAAKAAQMELDPYVDLGSVTIDQPRTPVMIGIRAQNRNKQCLVIAGGGHQVNGDLSEGEIRLADCDPMLSRQTWFLEESGQIRSSIADLCIEATDRSSKLFAKACNNTGRQRWSRDGNLLRVRVDGSTRCMKKQISKSVIRHRSCDSSSDRQQWLAFSPLRNGEASEFRGFGPFNPLVVDALGQEFDEARVEDNPSNPGLCVNDSSTPSLEVCDRFDGGQYWAEGGGGSFRPLLDRSRFLNVSLSSELQLGNSGSSQAVITRSEVGDGVFLFLNTAGNFVFAGAPEAGANLFADSLPVDENGEPVEFSLWRHVDGSQFPG